MKSIIVILSLIFSVNAQAANFCQLMETSDDISEEESGGPAGLTKAEWYKLDVLVNYSYEECQDVVYAQTIKIKGKSYTKYYTTDDKCDGGNTYGVVVEAGTTNAVAHVYDGDLYCGEQMSKDEKASLHRCNDEATAKAMKKMAENGLAFVPDHYSVEDRKPYTYSFVFIHGKITSLPKEPKARIQVNVNLETCKTSSASISYMSLR